VLVISETPIIIGFMVVILLIAVLCSGLLAWLIYFAVRIDIRDAESVNQHRAKFYKQVYDNINEQSPRQP
jgi:Na+-translocating ferredoxin:NAD+ oxidoreductase RnfG subunit